jgi:hypothetical protein
MGQTQQPTIRTQLDPQPKRPFDPILPRIGPARGLSGCGFEMQVPETAIATPRQLHALTDLGQIGKDGFLILVKYLGADRHAKDDIIAILAGALPPHARLTVLCEKMLLIPKINQRVQPIHSFGPNAAAIAAVPAVRATVFDEFFAAKADTAAPARARANIYFAQIQKFHDVPLCISAKGLQPFRPRNAHLR